MTVATSQRHKQTITAPDESSPQESRENENTTMSTARAEPYEKQAETKSYFSDDLAELSSKTMKIDQCTSCSQGAKTAKNGGIKPK
jgi:hypothetical protein